MEEEKIKYYLELVDDYLDGKISEAHKDKLLSDINMNPELQHLIKEHISARANVRIAGEKELKQKFNNKFETINEVEEQKPEETRSFTSYYFFAFILMALVLGAMYFLQQTNDAQPDINFASDISEVEDPSYDLLRSADSSGMEISWDTAIQLFAEKNYEAALNSLKGISEDEVFLSRHSGKLALMKGVSFMKLEQYLESEKELTNIGSNNPYYDQAEWYLALNYFYSNQEEKAKKQFNSIRNSSTHYKRNQTDAYLESLNNK